MSDGLSRRELLQRGAAGGALLLAPGALACSRQARAKSGPRIVIVGAGLAGLSCAYRLHQRGYASTVYEANPERIGGRCWTAREFEGGQIAEHGGEFIDSRHRRMRALARQFGLQLIDTYAAANPGGSRLWLKGALRRRPRLRPRRRQFQRRIEAAARRVGTYTYPDATRAAKAFDELSVADWLDDNIPGGSRGLQGQMICAEMASEFGLGPTKLSALNLFSQYVEPAPGADERYTVRGGNDQIPHGLAASLPDGTIRLGAALEALYARDDGTHGLRFSGIASDVIADRVVLAIPFATLRRVDLARSGLSSKKRNCIQRLGMGTNAKVLMQFERRPRHYGDWNGYMLSDDPFLWTWDSTLGQPGGSSIITTFFGGRSGGRGLRAIEPHAPTLPREVRRNLASISQRGRTGLDGLAAGFNGTAWTDRWVGDQWARCSYAAFEPGQYSRYFGYAGKPAGSVHFAGEHTATTNQGYLEGAVESGERAAEEIVAVSGSA